MRAFRCRTVELATGKDRASRHTNRDMGTETSQGTGPDVVRWRREQLAHSGFAQPLAARLADDEGYDLHALIELVERGCNPQLAARILAPLEGQSEPVRG
jgi:hypothetical protein